MSRGAASRWAWLGVLLLALVQLASCGWDDEPRPQVAVVRPLPAPEPSERADLVEVFKAERRMVLKQGGKVIRSYAIMLGGNPFGHKLMEGDRRTPEGRYIIDWRNPNSAFHRSLHIDYPNTRDILAGIERGQTASLGGMIMIHGMGHSPDAPLYIGTDWTNGCIAVTNPEMDEIWALVPDNTPIWIHP
jgi:murein L,D-transpeptidase YafK